MDEIKNKKSTQYGSYIKIDGGNHRILNWGLREFKRELNLQRSETIRKLGYPKITKSQFYFIPTHTEYKPSLKHWLEDEIGTLQEWRDTPNWHNVAFLGWKISVEEKKEWTK